MSFTGNMFKGTIYGLLGSLILSSVGTPLVTANDHNISYGPNSDKVKGLKEFNELRVFWVGFTKSVEAHARKKGTTNEFEMNRLVQLLVSMKGQMKTSKQENMIEILTAFGHDYLASKGNTSLNVAKVDQQKNNLKVERERARVELERKRAEERKNQEREIQREADRQERERARERERMNQNNRPTNNNNKHDPFAGYGITDNHNSGEVSAEDYFNSNGSMVKVNTEEEDFNYGIENLTPRSVEIIKRAPKQNWDFLMSKGNSGIERIAEAGGMSLSEAAKIVEGMMINAEREMNRAGSDVDSIIKHAYLYLRNNQGMGRGNLVNSGEEHQRNGFASTYFGDSACQGINEMLNFAIALKYGGKVYRHGMNNHMTLDIVGIGYTDATKANAENIWRYNNKLITDNKYGQY